MKKTSRFVALSIGLAICCGIALPAINYAVNIDTSTPATHGTRFHSLYLGNQETDPNATLMQVRDSFLYISNGIIAGKNNDGNGNLSSIGGGSNNTVNADNAGIAGGQENTVNGNNGIIGGGQSNTAGANATVIGGNGNTATGNGNILGGANGNAESNGTVLGGQYNSAGENGLALGQNSNGGLGSFTWNATEENDNSARVDAHNGVLIGTNTPISGVDLVVSGSIKLNEGQKIGTGLQGEVRVVDGCFYLYDGMTWNLISQADTGNCKGWTDTEGGIDISPAKTCEFGKIELKEGDKVFAYSATMNPNCESIKAEVTCKDGSLKTAFGDTKYIYSYCHDGTGEETIISCEPQPACGGNKCAQGKASAKLGDDSFTCASECGTKNCTCSGTTKWNTSTNSCTTPGCLGTIPINATKSETTPTEFLNWSYNTDTSQACTYICKTPKVACDSSYTLNNKSDEKYGSGYDACQIYTDRGNGQGCIEKIRYKVTSCQVGYELKNGKCELVVCPANTCTSDYTLSSPEAPNARTYTPCSNFSTDGLCTETKKWKIESCNLGNCDPSYTLSGENDPHATSYAECTSYKLENDCSPQHKYKVKTCEEGYSLGKDGLCHKDCYLEGDGTHVKYNEKIDAYTAQNPECPTNCGNTQERKCVGTDPENSSLNGNETYKYGSCNPQPVFCNDNFKLYSTGVDHAKTYAICTGYSVSNKQCSGTPKYQILTCEPGYVISSDGLSCIESKCGGERPPHTIGSTIQPTDNSLLWKYSTNLSSACKYRCDTKDCSGYPLTNTGISNAKSYLECTTYTYNNNTSNPKCNPITSYKVDTCESNDCSEYPLTGRTSNALYTSRYETCTTYTPTNSSCTPQTNYKPICKPPQKTCDSSFNLTERKNNIPGLSGYEECYDIGLVGGSCNKINTKYKLICQDGYELSADGKSCNPTTPVCIPETCDGFNLSSYSEPDGTKYSSCTKRDASCQETLVHQVVSCPVGNCTSDYTLTEQNVANAASYSTCTSYKLENGHCSTIHKYKVTCKPGYDLYSGSCVKICTPDTAPGCGNDKTGSAEKGSSTYKCGSTTCSCTDLGDDYYWNDAQKRCTRKQTDKACSPTHYFCNESEGRELKDGSTGATSTEYYWTCTRGAVETGCTEKIEMQTKTIHITPSIKNAVRFNGLNGYATNTLLEGDITFTSDLAVPTTLSFAEKVDYYTFYDNKDAIDSSSCYNPYHWIYAGNKYFCITSKSVQTDTRNTVTIQSGNKIGTMHIDNISSYGDFMTTDRFGYKPRLLRATNTSLTDINKFILGNTEYTIIIDDRNQSDPTSYTLTYNANGGSGAPSSQTFTQGNSVTLRSGEPTRTNYKFLGWSTSPTATVASYQPGHTYTFTWGNTTLYAVWEGVCNLVAQPGGTNGTIHTSDLSSISIDSSFGGTKSQPTITCGGNSGPIACTSTASYQNGTIYKYSTTENNNITRMSIKNNCTQIYLTVEPDESEPELDPICDDPEVTDTPLWCPNSYVSNVISSTSNSVTWSCLGVRTPIWHCEGGNQAGIGSNGMMTYYNCTKYTTQSTCEQHSSNGCKWSYVYLNDYDDVAECYTYTCPTGQTWDSSLEQCTGAQPQPACLYPLERDSSVNKCVKVIEIEQEHDGSRGGYDDNGSYRTNYVNDYYSCSRNNGLFMIFKGEAVPFSITIKLDGQTYIKDKDKSYSSYHCITPVNWDNVGTYSQAKFEDGNTVNYITNGTTTYKLILVQSDFSDMPNHRCSVRPSTPYYNGEYIWPGTCECVDGERQCQKMYAAVENYDFRGHLKYGPFYNLEDYIPIEDGSSEIYTDNGEFDNVTIHYSPYGYKLNNGYYAEAIFRDGRFTGPALNLDFSTILNAGIIESLRYTYKATDSQASNFCDMLCGGIPCGDESTFGGGQYESLYGGIYRGSQIDMRTYSTPTIMVFKCM